MKDMFSEKCSEISKQLETLNNLLEKLKERIVISDLSKALSAQVKPGRQVYQTIEEFEEIDIQGETFTLINKTSQKYRGYVILTTKEYHTVGLGFMYKKEVVSPHMPGSVDMIIHKYSDDELGEIAEIIDAAMIEIKQDIAFLKANPSISGHEHYYGEYNKGFSSQHRYDTISDVIADYKTH